MPARTTEERFWSHVSKGTDCWEWTGATRSGGYGVLRLGSRSVSAHRFAWELTNGPIPPAIITPQGDKVGYFVTHVCGNRRCVRPDHLRLISPDREEDAELEEERTNPVALTSTGLPTHGERLVRAPVGQTLSDYLSGSELFRRNSQEIAASLNALRLELETLRGRLSSNRQTATDESETLSVEAGGPNSSAPATR
jgi:HNH endonuclease